MDRKIRILFDANPLVRQRTGVGFYTEGLVQALAEIPQLELVGHYFALRGKAPALPRSERLTYTHNSWVIGMIVKGLRKCRIRLPWELLAHHRADVLLFPDFTAWPSIFGTPKILTIHDLTYLDMPDYVTKRNLKYLRRFVKHDADAANLILTISQFTKKRLVSRLGLPPAKILVEPIPPRPKVAPKPSIKLPKKFILFIATIEPRKNVANLIEAYNLLPDHLKKAYALVIAGGQGWQADDTIARIKQLQSIGLDIITTGYVDEATRAAAYSRATVIAIPSFYEGFGMQVLEAFSYDAPVIASNLPVLKESAGDAALYFDPKSTDEIRDALVKILIDEKLRQKQIQQGKAQLKKYSWSKVAADIYHEIVKLTDG